MSNRRPAEPEADVLPEAVATRLLARASELDATHATGSAVPDLRAAATEAGISARAFDMALAEARVADLGSGVSVVPASGRRTRRWGLGAVAAAVLAIGALTWSWQRTTTGADAPPTVPTVEEAVLLRCLPGGEALELIRPLLADRASRVTWNPSIAPRVLVVRTSPERLQQAKALLAKHDAAGEQACQTPAR